MYQHTNSVIVFAGCIPAKERGPMASDTAETMKAVYFEETGDTSALRFGDVPRPEPGAG